MIDFHCHIDLYPDPRSIVSRVEQECMFVLSVTTTPSAFSVTQQIGMSSNKIQTAVGLHPQLAGERIHELELFDSLISDTRFVGEVGLDGSPELQRTWKAQEEVFSHVLNACSSERGKIISIHSRRASSQVIATLKKYPDSGIPILHWFSGPFKDLTEAIDMGCWFSVGPLMVKSLSGRKLISEIPKERILTETDGPFVKYKDGPVYPWDIVIVEEFLADLWRSPMIDVKEQLKMNFKKIMA